jgi:glutamyl-Q tRNA(Asp) synthetase
MEDIDPPREQEGAAQEILRALDALQMTSDEPVTWQSQRVDAYQAALDNLLARGLAYPCFCTKRDVMQAIARQRGVPVQTLGGGNLVYPGTCRPSQDQKQEPAKRSNPRCSYRLLVTSESLAWQDRPAGLNGGQPTEENLARDVGDFNIRRSDGLWTYQLAVVVDDHFNGISDVVRGDDLADSTGRQIYLQQCLALPSPRTLHIPVLRDANGNKLSKQNGAPAARVDGPATDRIALLNQALQHLQLAPVTAETLTDYWTQAVARWAASHWMQE